MRRYHFVTYAFVIIFLASCLNSESDKYSIKKYFDVEGFVAEELAYFEKNPPSSIVKKIYFNGKEEEKKQSVSDLASLKEIAETANINKPAFKNSYKVSLKYFISGSDTFCTRKAYQLKSSENEIVKFINLYYSGTDTSRQNLKAILIHKNTHNFLYNNSQIITMQKNEHLKSAKLKASQKILFFSPTRFAYEYEMKY